MPNQYQPRRAVDRDAIGPKLPTKQRQRRTGVLCALCGLAAGNDAGILVHRFMLQRTYYEPREDGRKGRTYTRGMGSIGLCERCRLEQSAKGPRLKVLPSETPTPKV